MEIAQKDLKESFTIFNKIFSKLKTKEDTFYDLCFCICVPQTKYKTVLNTINQLRQKDFFRYNVTNKEEQSIFILSIISSIRFKNRKTIFLMKMKQNFDTIYTILKNPNFTAIQKRNWFIDNIDGIGFKTASHFMRNNGYKDFAIIDTHIIKFLNDEKPNTKSEYKRLEDKFINISRLYNVSPAILDLLIWKIYSNTEWNNIIY